MQPNITHTPPAFVRGNPTSDAALLDVGGVASLLRCSKRHIFRMADGGKMPRPIRLGRLLRFNKAAIERWISEGCPSVRQSRRAA